MKSTAGGPPENVEVSRNSLSNRIASLLERIRSLLGPKNLTKASSPSQSTPEQSTTPQAVSPQIKKSEDGEFARKLLAEVAQHLSGKMQISAPELLESLWEMREGRASAVSASGVVRVECALVKEAANRIKLCLRVLCQTATLPELISLERALSWDGLPREVRSEFIQSGTKELHYVLCELSKAGTEDHQ